MGTPQTTAEGRKEQIDQELHGQDEDTADMSPAETQELLDRSEDASL